MVEVNDQSDESRRNESRRVARKRMWVFRGVLLLAVFGWFAYKWLAHPRVVVGGDEVFYTGHATANDAKTLGNELKRTGYFKDNGATVYLDKSKDASEQAKELTTISMVVVDGAWNDKGFLLREEEEVREVAGAVGGFPVRVKVVDSEQNLKLQGMVRRSSVNGKDEVISLGLATQAQAEALDRRLAEEEYFSGRGASVFLSKDDDGVGIWYVVAEGFADDAVRVAGFEALTRAVAPAVGGLPVTMRLVNAGLDVKKEMVVR